jgi:hypothetical protein
MEDIRAMRAEIVRLRTLYTINTDTQLLAVIARQIGEIEERIKTTEALQSGPQYPTQSSPA